MFTIIHNCRILSCSRYKQAQPQPILILCKKKVHVPTTYFRFVELHSLYFSCSILNALLQLCGTEVKQILLVNAPKGAEEKENLWYHHFFYPLRLVLRYSSKVSLNQELQSDSLIKQSLLLQYHTEVKPIS